MGRSSRTRSVEGALSAAEPSAVGASMSRSVASASASASTPTAVAHTRRPSDASTAAAASAEPPDPSSSKAVEPDDRPAASGHRFGPDLACSECGTQWDAHQRDPTPCCGPDEPADVFLRRPGVS